MTTTVAVPGAAVSSTLVLVYTPQDDPAHGVPGTLQFAGHAFDLTDFALLGQGLPVGGVTQPLAVSPTRFEVACALVVALLAAGAVVLVRRDHEWHE